MYVCTAPKAVDHDLSHKHEMELRIRIRLSLAAGAQNKDRRRTPYTNERSMNEVRAGVHARVLSQLQNNR